MVILYMLNKEERKVLCKMMMKKNDVRLFGWVSFGKRDSHVIHASYLFNKIQSFEV